jgi:hypothetical protein
MLIAIGEGPVGGPANGLKSIKLNGTPIENEDGTFNFTGLSVAMVSGTNTQAMIPGFADVESEMPITDQEIKYGSAGQVFIDITNPNITAAVVKIMVPMLQSISTSTGKASGTEVDVTIDVMSNGGPYVSQILYRGGKIIGQCTSKYIIGYRVELPAGQAPWCIRVSRTTPDAIDANLLQNKTYLHGCTTVIDAALRYPNTALLALAFDASNFPSIPKVTIDMLHRLILVPSNYEPAHLDSSGAWVAGVYHASGFGTTLGAWDGTFGDRLTSTLNKPVWCCNPAWVYYDMATQPRFGGGRYTSGATISKADLYTIAQNCDVMVSDGHTGFEPRFVINTFLQSQDETFKVLTYLMSVCRATVYYGAGQAIPVQDVDGSPSAAFTPSNVIGGKFTYQGTARKARHTVALVSWNDPAQGGRLVPEYIEDPVGIARYGIQTVQVVDLGCSQGQARRMGRAILLSEQSELESVTFSAGLEGIALAPGALVLIADPSRARARMGGRILSATTTAVTLDAPVTLGAGKTYTLWVILPDGTMTSRAVTTAAGVTSTLALASALPAAPVAMAQWILSEASTLPTRWRIVSIKNASTQDTTAYQILAVSNNPAKYALIDSTDTIVPTIGATVSYPIPTALTGSVNPSRSQGSMVASITAAWTQDAAAIGARAEASRDRSVWIPMAVSGSGAILDNVLPGTYEIRVLAIYPTGFSTWTGTTVVVANSTGDGSNLVLNGSSEFGLVDGVAGYLVYDTTVGGTLPPDGRSGSRYVRLTSIDAPLPRRNCTGMVPCSPGDTFNFSGFINVKTDGTGTDPIGVLLEFFDAAGEALYPDGTHVGSDDSYKHYGTTLPSGASHDPWYPVGGFATAPPNAVGCVMFMDYPGGGVYRYDDLSLTRQVPVAAKLPFASAQSRKLTDKIIDTQTAQDYVLPEHLEAVRSSDGAPPDCHAQLQEFLADGSGSRVIPDGTYGLSSELVIDYSWMGGGPPYTPYDPTHHDGTDGHCNRISVVGQSMAGTRIYYNGPDDSTAIRCIGEVHDPLTHTNTGTQGVSGFDSIENLTILRTTSVLSPDRGDQTARAILIDLQGHKRLRNLNIGGFDEGLRINDGIALAADNVYAMYNRNGMVLNVTDGGLVSNNNIQNWRGGSFSHNTNAGIIFSRSGSGVRFENTAFEANGKVIPWDGVGAYPPIPGDTVGCGGITGYITGANGDNCLILENLYCEGNSGNAHISLVNDSECDVTVLVLGGNYNRVSGYDAAEGGIRYVKSCIDIQPGAYGRGIKLVLVSAAFKDAGGYVPSITRPFINWGSNCRVIAVGCSYNDKTAKAHKDMDMGEFLQAIKPGGVLDTSDIAGAIGTHALAGMAIWGKAGAAFDFSILNPASDAYYLRVPHGSNTPDIPWGLTVHNALVANSMIVGPAYPSNGSVTSHNFGVGDGVSTDYVITDASNQPVTPTGSPAFSISDWQGSRTLSTSASANYLIWSTQLWKANYTHVGLDTAVADDPAGGSTGLQLTATAANGTLRVAALLTGVPNGTLYNSVWIKRVTGSGAVKLVAPNSSTSAVTVASSWTKVNVSSASAGTTSDWGVQLATIGDSVMVAFGQCAPTLTSYVLTYGTPVTLAADYTTMGPYLTLTQSTWAGAVLSGTYSYINSGRMFLNANAGLVTIASRGAAYDWSLNTPDNTEVIAHVPTGTNDMEFVGRLSTLEEFTAGRLLTAAAGIQFGTVTYAQGRIGITANAGLSMWCKTGSLYDFALVDPANGSFIMTLPTGTTVPNFPQGLKSAGNTVGTVTTITATNANGLTVTITNAGTTPNLAFSFGAMTGTSWNGMTGAGTVAPPANSGAGSAGTPNGKYANETHYHPASGGGNAITMSYATLCGGPAISISETGGNYTTGSEFYLAAAATCTGIRFVGAAGRTYTLKLWSATGTLLASTTATPGATGVYSGTFAGVALNAGTKYYVSIYNAGYYVQTVLAAPFALAFPLLLAPICILNPRLYSSGDAIPTTPTTGTTYPVEPILA